MSRVQAAQLLLSPSVQAIGHCGARAGDCRAGDGG